MSRVRLAHALALLGILITTGGCAESATAPEATLRGASAAEAKASTPTDPTEPTDPVDDGATIQADGYMAGGGRAEQP
ncbi:MAG TPA: hypothetical protein VHG08_06850 [Longimicrobium sp.]|nr:hypothetical protein [Longimicrobium sp.]